MSEPQRFSSGELLQASRLNEILDYARPAYASVPGYGNQIFGSQSANGSAGPQIEPAILVYATEDFATQTTDSGSVDDVPSGLCDFVRLNRATNTHQNISGRAFHVHDVLAELSSSPLKVAGDVFYAIWNHDSKRWEITGGSDAGGKRIKFTIAEVWCIDAYNEELYVMVDWTHYTGGCGKTPPGVDYDGLIAVYDDCILSYITAEDLIGRRGSATFFFSREEYGVPCEGRWIVDDVCGTPECGDGDGGTPAVGCGTASWGWDEFSQTWNLNENNCAGNCEPQMPTSPPPDPDHTASLVTACAEGSGAQEVQGAAASSLVLTGFASTVTVSSVGCGTSNWGWDEFGQEWNLITNDCTGACTPQMPASPPANPDVPSTQLTNCA